MIYPTYFDSRKSSNLFGLSDNFILLKNLYLKEKLPKVLMLSGKKGSGKSTIINHLMFSIFDKENYNEKTCEFYTESIFYNQFINNTFSNIVNLSGADYKNTKIEDIRNLKLKIFQTTIMNKPRFIIFDDIELFNNNSLNALLKIIEEPTKKNYFILINNNSKPLLETIKSRCIEIKLFINQKKQKNIINSLIKKYKINLKIDSKTCELTPGQFIKFNYFFDQNKISVGKDFLKNISILLNLYKKNKDPIFINMISFLTDDYFNCYKYNKSLSSSDIIEYKRIIFENINKFFLYNLNQNALLNYINNKVLDE